MQSARPLGKFDRGLALFEDGLNMLAAGSIFVLMVLAAVQVLARKLFDLPIPGYIDIAEQSIAIFAFLGAAYCQRLGGHVRMELFLEKMGRGRLLWLAETVTTFAAFVIVAVLTRYSFDHFLRAWRIGDSTIDINLPVWPSKLLVSIALGFLALRLFVQLVGFVRLIANPTAEPRGVPVIASPVQHARQEIEAGTATGRRTP